eukprot:CAMPEP_0174712516 /NCGR_PEP_ID=MMETSP1094-20130205/13487_1 /TAXON_ID=156173 /ORGANISM="Chrysochromulina brevifilum, Strain UTEX LB 985" /LENGTH=41 /DNA_ID= /DNA_START= /DNA_END= /DNA_ORIENTATION=
MAIVHGKVERTDARTKGKEAKCNKRRVQIGRVHRRTFWEAI